MKLRFRSAGCSLFLRAEGFFCNLDVLYGGLGKEKLKFFIPKNLIFSSYNFLFFCQQNPRSGFGFGTLRCSHKKMQK
jgi:hypothetical protein